MKDFFSASFPKSAPGDVVRAHRKHLGLTLKELETITGIGEGNLSAMENGKKPIGSDTAFILGAALGVDAEFILFPLGYDGKIQKRVAKARAETAKLLERKARLLKATAALAQRRKNRAA